MGSRKKPDQEWTDIELPGMESVGTYDEEKPPKPDRHYGKVRYVRNKRMTMKCGVCSKLVAEGKQTHIEYGAFIRWYKEEPPVNLCFLHTTESKHQDKIAGRHFIG